MAGLSITLEACSRSRDVLLWMVLALSSSSVAVAQEVGTVGHWNSATLQGIRDAKLGTPVVARALAIVHTCMYDAWAAYDERAVGTQLGGALRRPASERTLANKEQAVSYAAYRALVDVLPVDTNSVYITLMKQLGYDPTDNSTDIETPTGIGNVACAAVLEFRHHDKSNQLGDLAQGPYSDWTGYTSLNTPSPVPARAPPTDPNHWQPLTYVNSTGDLMTQRFVGAQWCDVTPFAMSKGDEYRWLVQLFGPAKYGSKEYQEQAQELVEISAGLTDRQKMIAEYWSDGPNSEQPPGHWALFAQFVSQRDHHTLDDDVKMFFVLSNAILDAGIAAWDTKRAYDSVRPVTAIPFVFRSKTIRSWGSWGGQRHGRDGRLAMDSVSGGNVPNASISRLRVRTQHLQCSRRQDSGTLDRKRSLPQLRYSSGSKLKNRTGSHAGPSGNLALGNVHRRRQ